MRSTLMQVSERQQTARDRFELLRRGDAARGVDARKQRMQPPVAQAARRASVPGACDAQHDSSDQCSRQACISRSGARGARIARGRARVSCRIARYVADCSATSVKVG